MARKKSSSLTDAEHRIMEVLWNKGSATVADVADQLKGESGTAYTTILTLMRILRDKGYLAVRKRGRAHVYKPRIDRETAARNATLQLLGKFYDHSPGELVLNFLRHDDLQPGELAELKRQILNSDTPPQIRLMNADPNSLLNHALSALLNGVYQGILLTGLVYLVLKCFPKINASTRYAVWLGTLTLVAALPVAHFLSHSTKTPVNTEPNLSITVPEPVNFPAHESNASNAPIAPPMAPPIAPPIWIENQPWLGELSPEPTAVPGETTPEAAAPASEEPLRLAPVSSESLTPSTITPAEVSVPLAPSRSGWPRIEWQSPLPRWAGIGLVCGWILMGLFRLMKLTREYRLLMILKRQARPAPERMMSDFMAMNEATGSSRDIDLRVSGGLKSPVAAGFQWPTVLLPSFVVREEEASAVRQILRHELAHLHRWDDWTNLWQQLVKAVFFFHPAVWFLSRRLDLDREVACDDEVLASRENPRAYALTLTELAGRLSGLPLGPAPAAWNTKSQIKERISMILDKSRNTSPRLARLKTALLMVTALLAAGFVLHLGPRMAFAQDAFADEVVVKKGVNTDKAAEPDERLDDSVGEESVPRDPTRIKVERKVNRFSERVATGELAEPDTKPNFSEKDSNNVDSRDPFGFDESTEPARKRRVEVITRNRSRTRASDSSGEVGSRDQGWEKRLSRLEQMVERLVDSQERRPVPPREAPPVLGRLNAVPAPSAPQPVTKLEPRIPTRRNTTSSFSSRNTGPRPSLLGEQPDYSPGSNRSDLETRRRDLQRQMDAIATELERIEAELERRNRKR